jgi:hypothetical protein
LYDIQGKQVGSGKVSSLENRISITLSKGLYVLVLHTGGGKSHFKIIKS